MELAFGHGAVAEEADSDPVLSQHPITKAKAHGKRQPASDNGIAAIEIGFGVEQMHRSAATAGATGGLSVHLGEHGFHACSTCERVAVFAVGRHHPVARLQCSRDADSNSLFAIIEVQEAADLLLRVELVAFLLETADADHVPEKVADMGMVELHLGTHFASPSSVERSPSGSPSSRARSSRRMILPDRVRGRPSRNTISRGAMAGPSRLRA